MRRALPWASVALLTLGAGAGAGLGATIQGSTSASPSTPRQLVRIMVATRAAGTASFAFSEVSSSQNHYLRSFGRGQGVIDFATNSLRASERDRSTQFAGTSSTTRAVTEDSVIASIWIGRTAYLRFQFGAASDSSPWIRQATWPKNSFGPWGALAQFGPLGELDLDMSVPGLQLESRGPTVLRGIPTTAYLLVLPTCPTSKLTGIASASTGPVDLWVDWHGRLVQARVSTRVDYTKEMRRADHFPGGGPAETGRATDVSTIELGDFGESVDISAPPVHQLQGTGETGFAEAKRANCS